MSYKELIKYTKELKILYAEDDEITAGIIEDLFKVLFKEVTSVGNGLDAVREFERNKFDLIFLDIEMPIMNGLKAGEEIKKINPKQKVIFLTAFDEVDYLTDAMEIEADEFILKPLDEEEFLEKIYDLVT